MAAHTEGAVNPFAGAGVTATARLVVDARADLGEGPLWSVREQAIYWLDCTGRTISRHFPAFGRTQSFNVSGMPGSFAFRAAGGLIVAFRNRLAIVDLETGAETPIPSTVDFARERFNDGKCDRRGRFFVGTMEKDRAAPSGGLYRVDTDRSVTRVADGVTLSNGLAWSLDDRTMYHCESRPGYVYAYDYDIETGTPSRRRVLIDLSRSEFHPDGCAIDAEGCLWIAMPGSGKVVRYSPDGELLEAVAVPTARATSVTFGGAGLDQLFITSMRYHLPEAARAANPTAGGLFMAEAGRRGLAEPLYGG